ncbi:MAG: hypothetical protein K8I82_16675, partial [Anaerolineae bacterium]|nr:hypothetical protein [Anaerolineae bacterium]
MFQLYGLIPVNGDTHITEYVPFTSDAREKTWERFDIQLYDFAWSNKRRKERIQFLNEVANGQHELTPLKDDSQSERVEFMIDAMLHNQPRYEEAVNIPNRGYIPNLPDGVIVELPGMVDAEGISGVHVGPLPEPLAAICRLQLTIDDLNLEAYLNGDRQLVRQMFSIDPMIQDPDIAIKLADEYIDMNLDYLPTFR